MIKATVRISNKLGLHARASAKLTKLAGSFRSEVSSRRNGRRVNAKSIMGVMMLAAGIGTEIEIETEGEDEAAGDDGARRARSTTSSAKASSRDELAHRGALLRHRVGEAAASMIHELPVFGLPVSRGIAIGRAVLVASSRVDVAHYYIDADAGRGRDRPPAQCARRRRRRARRAASATCRPRRRPSCRRCSTCT